MARFAACGVTVERVLSDDGSACRSRAWREACAELGVEPERTWPYPAADQRKGRTIPPPPRRQLGLRQALPRRVSASEGPACLARRAQPSPSPDPRLATAGTAPTSVDSL